MYLSICSVLTYCTLVSVLTACICFILNQNKVICRIGPRWASMIAVLLIVRMFFPFEFDFTYTIGVPWVLPLIWNSLNYEFVFGGYSVHVWMILVLVWVMGIVFHFANRLLVYRQFMQMLQFAPKTELNDFLENAGLEKACDSKQAQVQVAVMEGLRTPCLVGIRKVYILLPKREYRQEELALIIQHELMHCKRKDIIWKSVIDVLCSVFWWNPAFKYLKKTVFRMVEIEDDLAITCAMTEEEKTAYMECMLGTALVQKGKELPFAVPFGSESMKELKQRIQIMDAGVKNDRWLGRGVVLGVIACLYLFSFVIFIPDNPPPVEGDYEVETFNYDSAFIIRNGDMYDVYENGEYVLTGDEEIAKSFTGVKIYDSMEERLKDE